MINYEGQVEMSRLPSGHAGICVAAPAKMIDEQAERKKDRTTL